MQLDKDNPWPGLESFEEDSQAFFFGRDHEIKLLRDHVLDSPVTVLYGRSGLGKTSLLRAGLFPLLRKPLQGKRHFLPIAVRFELKPGAAPLIQQLHHAVREVIQANADNPMLPSDEESLWEYLHRADFELWCSQNHLLTPVIVLDQFEELFTLGERVPDLVNDLRNALGDLAENRIPADLATRIGENEDLARRFDLRSRNYKLLISLREDFLPDLEGWCRLIPTLGRSRVRLLRLRTSEAVDAVHEPAAEMMTRELAQQIVGIVAGENLHPRHNPTSADAVVPDDHDEATEVEPALLSLFCRELNEERKRRGLTQFDDGLVEDAKRDTLSNYYASCVRDLRPEVARFIETELITEKGFRDSYICEDAVPAHITEEELDRLISSRLVRLEDRYGAPRIELTHDVLTGAVREHRDRRRAEEEKAELAEAAEQAREREHEAQHQAEVLLKRTRILYGLLALVVIVALVAALAFAKAFNAQHAAVRAQNAADARLQEAREANVERLYANSLPMLTGLSSLGSDEVTGMQMLLAAHAIPSEHKDRNYELLTAVSQERDLLKVIDLPAVVTSVAFSPDGNRIASGSADNTVRLWSPDGKPIGQPLRHDDWVTSVAFSPDGNRIATASADNTVRLWDTDGKPIGQPLRHDDTVLTVAFSPDGTRVASGGVDKTVRLWDAATGQPIGPPLRHDDSVISVAFSPDGSRIATGSGKTVRFWNVATGQPVGGPMEHDDLVNAVAFSRNGTLASASADKTVRLWDMNGQPIGEPLRHDDSVLSVAFSPDGTRIAAGDYDRTIRLWDAGTRQLVGVLAGHEAPVTAVEFSPDSLHLVSSGGNDGTVRLWDASSWQPMLGHTDTVWAGFFDNGRRIGSGSWQKDKTVRWWDAATERPIGQPLRVDNDDVKGLFPADGNRLLSFGTVDTAQLWDRAGKPIGEPLRLPPDPNRYIVTDDTASRMAVELKPGVVQVYDTLTMQPVGDPILRPEEPVAAIAFSRDGRIVATGGNDGTVRLWDSNTGAPIGQPMSGNGAVRSIAFSKDGRLLAVGCSCSSLQLWDTSTYESVGEPMALDSIANVAAFSPDGNTVASGSDDGSIQLWDVGNQSKLGSVLRGHPLMITSLEFSPDGTKLLSASDDHTLRLWPVPARSADAARDTLCAKLTHNMTAEQWKNMVSPEIDYIKVCPGLPEAEYSG